MKQVILHMGLPKTGTTSIQTTFHRNRRVLDGAGFTYPAFQEIRRVASDHNSPFINLFSDHPENYVGNMRAGRSAAEQIERHTATMAEVLKSDRTIVFSGEDISSLSEAGLARMAAYFAEAGRELRPVIAARPPRQYLEGMAQTIIRAGSPRLLPEWHLKDRLSGRIQQIRKVLPQTEVYPFAALRTHPQGPAGFMADLLQPGLSAKLDYSRANERSSRQAVALVRQVNMVLPMWVNTPNRRLNPLRMPGDIRPLWGLPGESFRLTASEIAPRQDEIAAENAWLAENLGPDFCDPPGDMDAKDTPLVWTEAHAEALPKLLRKLPRRIAAAAASYFAGQPDMPPALAALPARYNMAGTRWQRYKRSGPGSNLLFAARAKLRKLR